MMKEYLHQEAQTKLRFLLQDTKTGSLFQLLGREHYCVGAFQEGEKFVAFDNSTGDCFVEEFDTLDKAISWMRGEFEVI